VVLRRITEGFNLEAVISRITEGFNLEAEISGLEILRSIGKESALRS
jgi:hypothetical protein